MRFIITLTVILSFIFQIDTIIQIGTGCRSIGLSLQNAQGEEVAPQTEVKKPIPAEEMRKRYIALLPKFRDKKKFDLVADTQEMLLLYEELLKPVDQQTLPFKSRANIKKTLGNKLIHSHQLLLKKYPQVISLINNESTKKVKTSRVHRSTIDDNDKVAGGLAGEIAIARQLILLIQETVEPHVWKANGGNSTIYYMPNLKVLVIRAPQSVHSQIGGN